MALERLFAHEHGLYGDLPAGEEVADGNDPHTGPEVRSLYGGGPVAPEALSGLDLVLVDMQERGARYYTVLGTTLRLLALCREADVPMVMLDRPNPLGRRCEGPWHVPAALRSLVAAASVPIRHGLTLGELVRLAAAERGLEAWVEVVPVERWRRAER